MMSAPVGAGARLEADVSAAPKRDRCRPKAKATVPIVRPTTGNASAAVQENSTSASSRCVITAAWNPSARTRCDNAPCRFRLAAEPAVNVSLAVAHRHRIGSLPRGIADQGIRFEIISRTKLVR